MGILTQRLRLLTAAKTLIRAWERLLPQACLLCGASADALLCTACADDLPQLSEPGCPRCAQTSPRGEICGHCLTHPTHFDHTTAVYAYGFPVDRLIQRFKYQHRLSIGLFLGRAMARRAGDLRADRVIPLPLHASRLRERGFNQALELARPIAAALDLPLDPHSCTRSRATPAQAGLHWKEREKNIRGAFSCARDLTGQRILLVDDVMTTGASLNECARTLKLHGAAEVIALVAARALRS